MKKHFDIIPDIAYSSDNYGHSAALASIMSEMGFNGYIIENQNDKIISDNNLEFIWEPYFSLNTKYKE